MLIADVHIEGHRLANSEPTLQWLLEEKRRLKPSHVFILGDAVHCRKADIPAVQRLKTFVNDLIAGDNCKVHLLVGNHDMPNLHDRSVSTVALIAQEDMGIHVYPDVSLTEISGTRVLFIPWHENGAELPKIVKTFSEMPEAAETYVFGHLGIKGARLSGYSHGSSSHVMHDENAHVSPGDFDAFKWTFLGHYHDPKTHGKTTYVGAPMQHNFGDAHISQRGYISLDPTSSAFKLHVNPHGVHFVDVPYTTVISADLEKIKTLTGGKSVRLLMNEGDDEHRARSILGACVDISALKAVRNKPRVALPSVGGTTEEETPVEDPRAFLLRMVKQFSKERFAEKQRDAAASYMLRMCETLVSQSTHNIFHADILSVVVENFLGIQGRKVFNFEALPRGIFMIQGPNGAGKSQLIDSVAWCLFAKTFRGAAQTELKNNNESDKRKCLVTVHFGNGTVITRTLKPSLKVILADGQVIENGSGVKDTQAALNAILNCDWETFRRTVVLDSADFLSLFTKDDAQRNSVLEGLLGMRILDQLLTKVESDHKARLGEQSAVAQERDKLDAILRRSVEQQKHMRTERNNLARQLATLEAERDQLHGDVTCHDDKDEDDRSIISQMLLQLQSEKTIQTKVVARHMAAVVSLTTLREKDRAKRALETELRQRISSGAKDIETSSTKIQAYKAILRELDARPPSKAYEPFNFTSIIDCAILHASKSGMQSVMDGIQRDVVQPLQELSQKDQNIDNNDESLGKSQRERIADECHEEEIALACNQQRHALDTEKLAAACQDDTENMTLAESEVQGLTDEVAAAKTSVETRQNAIKEIEGRIRKRADKQRRLVERRGEVLGQISQMRLRDIELRDNIQLAEDAISQANVEMGDIDKRGLELAVNVDMMAAWKDALTATNDNAVRKQSSTRGVFRRLCRSEHLRFLQIRIEANLDVLLGSDARMACVLSDAFQVQPTGASTKWSQRSSGERKKTILAILFAILDSMMTFGQFRPCLLTLDEVHDNLDIEGRNAVHRLIAAFKKDHPRHRIFIISHDDSSVVKVDGTITVHPGILGGSDRSYAAQTSAGLNLLF